MSRRLRLYTGLLIAAGFGALVLATALMPVDPRIGIVLPSPVALPPVPLGIAFWTVLALVGSAVAPERPQAFVVTFDLPFIVASTVLGGPVAGAWVAMIGSLELSEVPGNERIGRRGRQPSRRRVPWYGALFNHAAMTLAAVAAGLGLRAAQQWLGLATSVSDAGQDLVGVLVVALIVIAITDATTFEVLAQRSARSVAEVAREFGFGYRATLAAEAILAWLMVQIFVPVGWWGAALCVAAIAAIYNGLDVNDALHQGRVDPLTGLWNGPEFDRRGRQLLSGRRPSDRRFVVMWIELQDLEQTNRRYGHQVGNDVLRLVAQRMRRALRPADDPARLEAAGVYGALLVVREDNARTRRGLDDAERIAWRLHRDLTAPLELDHGQV
ncbi:MAG TPA: diguanylate cyclase, partial [Candidatus Limnocylindrales bacterium]